MEVPDEISNRMSFGDKVVKAITFSGDGKHFMYITKGSDNLWHIVFDGAENPGFEKIDSLVVSEEGDHYAYVAQVGNQEKTVVVDGKPGSRAGGLRRGGARRQEREARDHRQRGKQRMMSEETPKRVPHDAESELYSPWPLVPGPSSSV